MKNESTPDSLDEHFDRVEKALVEYINDVIGAAYRNGQRGGLEWCCALLAQYTAAEALARIEAQLRLLGPLETYEKKERK